MDRSEVLQEYARILDDASDWLSGGYREYRERPPDEMVGDPFNSGRPAIHPAVEAGRMDGSDTGRSPVQPGMSLESESGDDGAGDSLERISREVAECRACTLYLTRERTVPGTGPSSVTLLVVTPPPFDAGSADGHPLPGSEREYLDKWLAAVGLNPRTDVFVTPAVKCRTPGGRPPHAAELNSCALFLARQYKLLRPSAVLALGSAACGVLTGDPRDYSALVGRDWTWGAVPALVLWTPAEVLAHPQQLRGPVWEALKRLRDAWNAVPGHRV